MPDPNAELSAATTALLDAITAIASDLDVHTLLHRLVTSAATLTGARQAALGVIGGDGRLLELVSEGIDAAARAALEELPTGRDDTSLRVPVRIRGTVFGNLWLSQKADDGSFTRHDELLVSALAAVAGPLIDHARAYGVSERRRQWLEAAAELSDALQPPIDLDAALEQITNKLRAVSGAAATALVLLPEGGPPVVAAVDGPRAALVTEHLEQITTAGTEFELGDLTGVVLRLRAHLADPGLLVALLDGDSGASRYDERELLASFADHAALALDRAQAVEDRAELAVVSDRDRIARDLHDVVIQRLFATGLQLQGARGKAVKPSVIERIDKAVDDLDLTIKDIRGTIFELQSRQGRSLRAGLRDLVGEYAAVLGFAPTVRTVGPVDTAVSPVLAEHLLAVAREAVSNLTRHARADHAGVEVAVDAGQLVLTVTDDGVGLPAERTESGLRNARRRAAALGGTLELTDNEPRGTLFVWRVPLG